MRSSLVPILVLVVCASQAAPHLRLLSPEQEKHLETAGIASGVFGQAGFVSGGYDGAILRHDARGAPGESPLPVARWPVDTMALLGDGTLIAGSGGRLVHVPGSAASASDEWSAGGFTVIGTVPCLAKEQTCFVAGDDRGMLLFGSAAPWKKRLSLRGANGGLRGLMVLPRGGLAFVSDDGLLQVVAAPDRGAPRTRLALEGPGSALALAPALPPKAGSPEAGVLLAAGSATGHVLVLRVVEAGGSGTPAAARLTVVGQARPLRDAVSALAFSPDGTELLAGTRSGRLVRLGVSPGKLTVLSTPTLDFAGHLDRVLAIRPTPSGWQTAARDGLVRNWTPKGSPLEPAYLGHRDAVTAVRFLNDTTLVSGGGSEGLEMGVRRWSRAGVPLVRALNLGREEVTSIDAGPGGSFAVGTRDNRLHLFPTPTGAPKSVRLSGTPIVVRHIKGGGLAIGDDRGNVLVTDGDGTVRLRFKAHKSRTVSLAVAPDGRKLVTGSWDDSVRLFDGNGKSLWVRKDHKSTVSALAWTRDGQTILSGSWDKRIHVRSATTGNVRSACEGHTDWVRDIAVHPTKELFVSVGDDRRLILWDFSCSKLAALRVHQDVIASVDISPDGTLVATGGRDRRVYVIPFSHLGR